MTARTSIHRLQVASNLHRFINEQVLPGTGVDSAAFWQGFDAIVAEYMTHLDEEIENAEAHLNVIPATPAAVFGAIGAAYSE